MNVAQLKKLIKNLPDETPICGALDSVQDTVEIDFTVVTTYEEETPTGTLYWVYEIKPGLMPIKEVRMSSHFVSKL